jgi:hypothetical protein
MLFGTVRFAGKVLVVPELVFELDNSTCVYCNLFNGNEWD